MNRITFVPKAKSSQAKACLFFFKGGPFLSPDRWLACSVLLTIIGIGGCRPLGTISSFGCWISCKFVCGCIGRKQNVGALGVRWPCTLASCNVVCMIGGVVIDLNANGYPKGSTNEWSYDRTGIEMMVFLWCLQAGHSRIDRQSRQ